MAASVWGRTLGSYGHPENGLDVATLREVAEVLAVPPIGDRRGALVVGPVDILTQEGVIDILLKTIEEFDPRNARPYLWAWGIGSVRPTIQSRCLLEWCPGQMLLDPALLEVARTAIDATLRGSTVGVLEAFAELRDGWKDSTGDFPAAVAQILAARRDGDASRLWVRLRPLLAFGNLSYHEALAGFLP